MIDNSEKTKAQLAMERLARPLSSYPRTGKIAKTISYVDKNRLYKSIEPKIKQNEIERRESVITSEGVVLGNKYKDDCADKEMRNIDVKRKG